MGNDKPHGGQHVTTDREGPTLFSNSPAARGSRPLGAEAVAHRLGRLIGLMGRLERRLSKQLRQKPDDWIPDGQFIAAVKAVTDGLVRGAQTYREWDAERRRRLSDMPDQDI